MNRSRLLLLLLILLAVAVTYAWWATPRQQRVADRKQVMRPAERLAESRQGQVGTFAGLDFSGGEKVDFKNPKRDLFRPLYQKPKPAPPVKLPEPEPVVEPKVVLPPPVIERPAPKTFAGTKPIPPLKVLGFLQKGERKTVFLASPQGEVYLVQRGERFADGLIVSELNEEKIVISRNQTDRGLTLMLDDQVKPPASRPAGQPPRSLFQPSTTPNPRPMMPFAPGPFGAGEK